MTRPYTIDTAADLVEDVDLEADHDCPEFADCSVCVERAEDDR